MKFFLLITSFLLSVIASAQWSSLSDFPDTERFGAIDFTVNNEAYVMGGIIDNGPNYSWFDELWKFDAVAETWTQVSTYPGGTMFAGISFEIGGTVYVGLGAKENGSFSNEFWAFDPSNGSWTQKANFPGNGRIHGYSFTSENKGFVGGGEYFVGGSSNLLFDFWEYLPATDSWSQKSNYPGSGAIGLVAMTIGDVGYVGLGDDDNVYFNDFYSYNTALDSWITLSSFPGSNRAHCATTTAGGVGYLIGGEGMNGNYTNQMWSFDPNSNQWGQAFDFSGTPRAFANLFYLNDHFYYGLGLTGPNDSFGSKEFWKYSFPTVGIESVGAGALVSVYPNPVSDQLQITLSEGERLQKVTVSTLLGETVFEGTSLTIPFQGFSSQVYFVTLHLENEVVVRRVAKT